MCGFPLIHLDRHLKTLVQHEKRFVAMCEEFPRPSHFGIKEFDRRVSRVITPGTLIDESFLNPLENNYLVAISLSRQNDVKTPVGLAWIDVSTGEFFSEICTLESLQDEIARLAPREIVLDSVFKTLGKHPIFTSLSEESSCLIAYTSSTRIANPDKGENATMAPLSIKSLNEDGFTNLDVNVKRYIASLMNHVDYAESLTPDEVSAINLLTVYLQETMLEHMPLLTSPSREGVQERMHIDAHTIKGLEIRENVYDGGTKGSLLSVLKRTVTNGGTRLLARWLCKFLSYWNLNDLADTLLCFAGSPSTSITEIDARQALVAFFSRRPHFRVDVSETLKRVDDVGRLCQKFLLGRADFTDLSSIHASIEVWTNLSKQFQQEKAAESTERLESPVHDEWNALDTLFSELTDLDALSSRIAKAIFADAGDTKTSDTDDTDDIIPDDIITEEDTTLEPLFPDKDSYKWVINPKQVFFFNRSESTTKNPCDSFSEKLSSLHALFENLLKEKEKLERELQLKYGMASR
jgi:DNA mismatch repair ATPase MutS